MKKFVFIFISSFLFLFPVCADETEPFRIKDRSFEAGLANIGLGASNSLLPISSFFKKNMIIDLDKINSDLNVTVNLFCTPLHFRYRKDNNWGVGLSTTAEAFGFADISENLLSLSEARNDTSTTGAEAFAGIAVPVFFHIQKFKITIQPSLFYPIVYVVPDISYTNYSSNNGSALNLSYSMRMYTIASFKDRFNGISASPGVDFKLGVEYPLSEVLELNTVHRILSFDAGLDIINLPVIPSAIRDYMEKSGAVTINNLDLDTLNFDNFVEFNDNEIVYGKSKTRVLRPFKMLAWVNWQPLGTSLLSITPILGFSINPLYPQPASFEGGVTTRLDVANLFIVSLGINYTDRCWKNGLEIILNCRAVELDLGINLQAKSFAQSWTGYGFGAMFGMKFGW